MEPPASPRKPRRTKNDGDTPEESSAESGSPKKSAASAKPAPKPRTRKTTPKAETPIEEVAGVEPTPALKPKSAGKVASPPPPTPEPPASESSAPEIQAKPALPKAPASNASPATPPSPPPTAATSVPVQRTSPFGSTPAAPAEKKLPTQRKLPEVKLPPMPKVTIPKITIPKLNLAERAASVQKSKGYALARTLGRRNAEMIRKYGARAGVAARQASVRTAQRVKAARIDSKSFSQVVQQTRSAVRQPGPWFDNAVSRLQARLEKSDAAVLIFTVGVIVACIALTWLAVYLWNRF